MKQLTVAVLSPIENSHERKRKLGTYEGIATFTEVDGGKITEEEFLGNCHCGDAPTP